MGILATILRALGVICMFCGAVFFVAATIGVIRMPDPYNRGHVAGKGDSPGFLLCLFGTWCYWVTISPAESLKILVIIVFMLFANPIAIHSILRLCYRQGIEFSPGTTIIEDDD